MAATYDGSIRINTKIDTAGATTGLNTLMAGLKSFATMVGIAFSAQIIYNWAKAAKEAWSTQTTAETKLATVMRQRVGATNDEIQSILDLTAAQQKLGVIGDEVQLSGAQQLATFTTTTDQLKELIPAMNNLVAQQYGYDATTESAVNVANMMGKVLEGQTAALTRVGISLTDAQEQMIKYGDKTQRAAVIAEVITDNVGQMNTALASTPLGREKQLSNVMGDVNEQFGRAITTIGTVFIPVLSALANWLSHIAYLANLVAQMIANLFGAQTSGYDSVSSSADDAASSIDGVTDATTASGEAAKNSLATFDELNTLSDSDTSTSTATDTDTGTDDLGTVTGVSSGTWNSDTLTSQVSSTIDDIVALFAGVALLAVGAVLAFSGVNLLLGIGLMAAGAVTIAAETAANWDTLTDAIDGPLTRLTIMLSEAALVLGALFCFSGVSIPLGIALLISGAAGLATTIAVNWNSMSDNLRQTLTTVSGVVGLFLLVLGAVLTFTGGAAPLGIGMMIAGGAGLATAVALNWDYILDKLTGAWQAIKGWWNTSVKPKLIALADWIAQNVIDPILGGVESFINFFIDGLNWLIEKINSISFDLPEILGGGHIGFDLPTLEAVQLPRLAQGAVIPPNREFVTIMGDQKYGNNLELPESLLRKIGREEGWGGSSGGAQYANITLQLDGKTLVSRTFDLFKGEEKRRGPSLVNT